MELKKVGWLLQPMDKDKGQLLLGTSGARSWSGRPRSLEKKSSMDGCDTAPHSALPPHHWLHPWEAKNLELSLQGPEVGKVPTKLLEVWTPPSSVIFCATDTGKLCLLGDWNDSCREVRSGSLPISGPRL